MFKKLLIVVCTVTASAYADFIIPRLNSEPKHETFVSALGALESSPGRLQSPIPPILGEEPVGAEKYAINVYKQDLMMRIGTLQTLIDKLEKVEDLVEFKVWLELQKEKSEKKFSIK